MSTSVAPAGIPPLTADRRTGEAVVIACQALQPSGVKVEGLLLTGIPLLGETGTALPFASSVI